MMKDDGHISDVIYESSSLSSDNVAASGEGGTYNDSLSLQYPPQLTRGGSLDPPQSPRHTGGELAATASIDLEETEHVASKLWWKTGRGSAFVTFLKALFGVSLLSSPRVFNETGLLLGTILYIIIILACAFACYLLLQARAVVVDRSRMEQITNSHAHIVTYGELGRRLLGSKASVVITFLIVILHLLFGAGMVSGAMHEFMGAFEMEDEHAHEKELFVTSSDVVLAFCLFPIVCLLLQFKSLSDLVRVCGAGLLVYLVGCVGTMIYATVLKSLNSNEESSEDRRGGPDAPDDMWEWKFRGIPTFIGSTICAIEGINLALPTANRLHARPKAAVPVVSTVVFSYGLVTLCIAWIGYLGGLGGGEGTKHGEDSCHDISYCLDSEVIRKIHQLSMSAALVLTLPIILFPSLEMLEVWIDERNMQLEKGRTSSNRTIPVGWNGFVYGGQSFHNYSRMMKENENKLDEKNTSNDATPPMPFMSRHWKVRVAHAAAVCVIGALERGSFKPFFTLLTGVGLSIAGFMLPCVLYMYAKETVSLAMKLAMVALFLLGVCNMFLVFASVFGTNDFIGKERDAHRHHEEEEEN